MSSIYHYRLSYPEIFELFFEYRPVVAEFPEWLTDLTGLTSWPGLDPPYLPVMDFDFDDIPWGPTYSQQTCYLAQHSCSFDCHLCVAPRDIQSCHHLVQTFDDGPTADTPTLLQYLHSVDQKATFFVLGIQAVTLPDTLRATYREGHLIGSHTYGHRYLPSMSNYEIVAQIQWATWALNATIGVVPKYFRPPFGGVDNRIRAIAERLGLTVVLWDLDTNDWRLNDYSRTEEEIYNQVQLWKDNDVRGIMLEHDNSYYTVAVGIEISKIIGPVHITIANCRDRNSTWYQ
ncbi:carbohydrate esterase [Lipomyces japonicus]|uniref:carbohydrate esterase n=1 Tax=Lipomyces japonicus TaxID=56871 RepID=UPI0034CD68A4